MPNIAQLTSYASDVLEGKPAKLRSPRWAHLRSLFLVKGAKCAACGYTKSLNVHHVLPFSLYPEKELDSTNLIVLGEACPGGNHHLMFGHLLNWKSFNVNVRTDAATFLQRLRERPEVKYAM